MKQLLLATALTALPVTVFSGVEHFVIGPAPLTAEGAAQTLHGMAVTDVADHPLPCEIMLTDPRDGRSAERAPHRSERQIMGFQSGAKERCNADDDRRADAVSARVLAPLLPAQVTR